MKKIIHRLILSLFIASPVWIILKDLWVGLLVAFLAYMVIHFFQFVLYVTSWAQYEYFAQHFIDAETGKKITAEELQISVEADPVYMSEVRKIIRRFL